MWSLIYLIEILSYLIVPVAIVGGVLYVRRRQAQSADESAQGSTENWLTQLSQFLQAQDPYLQTMRELQALIAQAQQQAAHQQGQRQSSSAPPSVSPQIQAQFQAKYFQAQQQMQHMDRLARERCGLSRASMLGQASSIGVDVSSFQL